MDEMARLNNSALLLTIDSGSFGNAILNWALGEATGFYEVRILSRDEKKQNDMRLR